MITYKLLILLSSLVIFSYLFEILARKTRFPSVLLLLALGIGLRFVVDYFQFPTVNFFSILPTLGIIGLVLIVLEGSLELKYHRTKNRIILKSFLSALFILLITTAAVTYIFYLASGVGWNKCIVNAIPYSIISSAIAIPSVANLSADKKEFIVYESSFSDIIGIMVFNFFLFNEKIDVSSFTWLAWDTLMIGLVSAAFCLLLLYIIGRIKHQIKFFLIISIIILVYSAGAMLHLPALIVVLAFGLFLSNAGQIKNAFFKKYFMYGEFYQDLEQMHRISAESAFLIRTFFFIVFGFIIETGLLTDPGTIRIGLSILVIIYLVRGIYLKLLGSIPLLPELFISPRGLISILMFISIPDKLRFPETNTGLLFLVILSTSLVMLIGLLLTKNSKNLPDSN